MNILLLNQAFYSDAVSTAQHLGELAAALAEKGHQVTVVTGRRAYDDPEKEFPALDTLMRAAERLKDDKSIVFCFVGGGSEFKRVQRRVADGRRDNVLCLPYQPLAQLSGMVVQNMEPGRKTIVPSGIENYPQTKNVTGW